VTPISCGAITLNASMGKKRRSEPQGEEEQWGAGSRALAGVGGGASTSNGVMAANIERRERSCRAHLEKLNTQFARWVVVGPLSPRYPITLSHLETPKPHPYSSTTL